MGQYENFAYIYDELMEDVEYERWSTFIADVIKTHGLDEKSICELGCGTGTITELLCSKGYDMIGIDMSEDMLMVAREKALESGADILYLQQDMREMDLYGSVDSVLATCDSFNYVDIDGLTKVFKSMKNFLNYEGLFIFDLNTEYKFEHIYSNKSFSELGEDFAYIWENHYNKENKLNEYFISFFIEDEDGNYQRFDEYHKEYIHEVDQVIKLAKDNDFEILGIYDDYQKCQVTETTERMTFVLKRKAQNG